MPDFKHLRRNLREGQTDAEKKFWEMVRNRRLGGFKFKRQEQIERYIVDFVCFEKGLIVELDGGQHNDNVRDCVRAEFLEGKGFLVKRYWNNEVMENMDGVLCDLMETLNTLTPTLSLKGEGASCEKGGA